MAVDQAVDGIATEVANLKKSVSRLRSKNSIGPTPQSVLEQLSVHLWTTHQLDAFRRASGDYGERLTAAVPADRPPIPRLGITVIGYGVDCYNEPLFHKLRAKGAYYSHVKPENGLRLLLDAVAARAKAHPAPYAHW